MQVWQHSCDVFLFLVIERLPVCLFFLSMHYQLLNVVEAGWNQTLVISVLERWLFEEKIKGVFQADGASPLEALLLQHHQVNEYRQPQIILSLRKRICSMEMTHLITSPCRDIHALVYTCQVMHRETTETFYTKSPLFSVSYLLDTFFYCYCVSFIYRSKWFDVIMTVLASAHPSGRTAHVIYLLIICTSKLI